MGKITKTLGFIFGATGIGLLAYSTYIYFFLPAKQELPQILPSENFEFIAFQSSETENIHYKNIQKKTSFYTPQKNETVVSYFNTEKNRSELIIITEKKYSKTKNHNNLLCKEIKKYKFCTSTENTETLAFVLNFITQKKKKTLATLPFFRNIDISNTLFFGTSEFLIKNIEASEANTENTKNITKLFIFAQDVIPYFSGNIINNTIALQLHKNNTSLIFNNNSQHLEALISSIDTLNSNYIYVSQPQKIIELIQKNTISKNFVNQTSEYKKFTTLFSNLFKNKISYFNDIEPLLQANIFINEKFVAISFVNKKIAQKSYEKYYKILQEISEEIIPEKKCFTLSDSSEVCEIFPSEKNVNRKTENGYTTFTTKTNTTNEERISIKSIMIIENTIFLSNSNESDFDIILQQNKKIPTQNNSTYTETPPFFLYKNSTMKISGTEKENMIEFSGIFLQ